MNRGQALAVAGLFTAGLIGAAAPTAPAHAATIIEEWANVKPPPAPELKPLKVDPKTTAFLVLDLVKQTCNMERRPRCIDSIPKVQQFLTAARAHQVPVIYSLIFGSKVDDIMNGLAPLGNEPVVQAGPEKFIGTDLEKILKDRGITTLIIVGTAAHGAVLYTASGAALRGFKVFVPVEGMSGENLYAEQATAWTLTNAPSVSAGVSLTSFDMISF